MFPLRNFQYTDPLTLLLGYKILACPCYILEIEHHSILKLLFPIVKVLNKLFLPVLPSVQLFFSLTPCRSPSPCPCTKQHPYISCNIINSSDDSKSRTGHAKIWWSKSVFCNWRVWKNTLWEVTEVAGEKVTYVSFLLSFSSFSH